MKPLRPAATLLDYSGIRIVGQVKSAIDGGVEFAYLPIVFPPSPFTAAIIVETYNLIEGTDRDRFREALRTAVAAVMSARGRTPVRNHARTLAS